MAKHHHKLRLSLYAIFTLVALVIIVDFGSPGSIIKDEIIKVQKERQQYYNAAGNHHYSYKIITRKHEFSVGEDLAELEFENEKIEYSVSRIFKEVNWYKMPPSRNKSYYSLRIVSGLVLPLLALISILIAFRFRWRIDIPVFVLQVSLIADLIYLMV